LRRSEHLIASFRFKWNICRHHPFAVASRAASGAQTRGRAMNGIIYLVGLIVVIMFILSFLGLR
jgi:hypothetical protein